MPSGDPACAPRRQRAADVTRLRLATNRPGRRDGEPAARRRHRPRRIRHEYFLNPTALRRRVAISRAGPWARHVQRVAVVRGGPTPPTRRLLRYFDAGLDPRDEGVLDPAQPQRAAVAEHRLTPTREHIIFVVTDRSTGLNRTSDHAGHFRLTHGAADASAAARGVSLRVVATQRTRALGRRRNDWPCIASGRPARAGRWHTTIRHPQSAHLDEDGAPHRPTRRPRPFAVLTIEPGTTACSGRKSPTCASHGYLGSQPSREGSPAASLARFGLGITRRLTYCPPDTCSGSRPSRRAHHLARVGFQCAVG